MRISSAYANTDSPVWAEALSRTWPQGGEPFSYDMGGTLRGADYDGDFFCAEVKNYQGSGDQGTEFYAFLAKCYVARQQNYMLGRHFMWITWAPFLVTAWSQLDSPEKVKEAVVRHRNRIFGDVSETEAAGLVDDAVAASVADRLWLIVLSRKQENLMPLTEWRAIVEAELVRKGKDW
ncbi:hypothetical protein ACFVVX_21830 [Kitasatospora sp. NPDC058170]|uniref:hypothetical protein n=1 Tax=Kitasatospora sp. NPDC058170 TaxID=3346364 RepID=UPI0036DD8E06